MEEPKGTPEDAGSKDPNQVLIPYVQHTDKNKLPHPLPNVTSLQGKSVRRQQVIGLNRLVNNSRLAMKCVGAAHRK